MGRGRRRRAIVDGARDARAVPLAGRPAAPDRACRAARREPDRGRRLRRARAARRELLWQAGLWLPPKTEQTDRARVRRQLELPLDHPYEGLRFGSLAADERLLAEYQVMGFAASGHPLSLLRGSLPPGVVRSDTLIALEHEARVEIVGVVVARQRPHTAKGFVFVLMEDEARMINVIVRPDIYDRDRVAVRGEPFRWVTGKLAKDDGTLNIIAEEVRALKVRAPSSTAPSPPPDTHHSPYRLLKNLRQHPPGTKDWG